MSDDRGMRPLVRAYGLATGKPVSQIRSMEKKDQVLSDSDVLWIGPATNDPHKRGILRMAVVRRETPAFAEALEKYADSEFVQNLRDE
jgi:hypothetical protein